MGDINYNTISKKLEISPKALERLTGSLKIEVEGMSYELGLRFERKFLEADLHPRGVSEDQIVEACRKYEQSCPAIYKWIARGDFVPELENSKLPPATIIHACRSAGRLRAEFMRNEN